MDHKKIIIYFKAPLTNMERNQIIWQEWQHPSKWKEYAFKAQQYRYILRLQTKKEVVKR